MKPQIKPQIKPQNKTNKQIKKEKKRQIHQAKQDAYLILQQLTRLIQANQEAQDEEEENVLPERLARFTQQNPQYYEPLPMNQDQRADPINQQPQTIPYNKISFRRNRLNFN